LRLTPPKATLLKPTLLQAEAKAEKEERAEREAKEAKEGTKSTQMFALTTSMTRARTAMNVAVCIK
jgi:hypothetical protein